MEKHRPLIKTVIPTAIWLPQYLKGMFKMTLLQSALGLAASVLIAVILSYIDKKSGADKYRVIICVAGIMSMMCLFFLLVNLLVVSGALG